MANDTEEIRLVALATGLILAAESLMRALDARMTADAEGGLDYSAELLFARLELEEIIGKIKASGYLASPNETV